MDFGFGIKIHPALFIAFTVNDALPLLEIYIGNIQIDQFAYTDSRGVKHIDHGDISDLSAVIPHHFNGFVRNHFFDHSFGLDLMDAPHRAFQNIIFFLKPGEEAGYISSDIINCNLAAIVDLLVIHQVTSHLIGGYFPYWRGNMRE